MAINLSSISTYVDENKIGLIRNSVIGARTLDYINIQTGVVGPTTINLLSTDVTFGDGSACGWNEAGTSELTQRTITPAMLKVNRSFCDKKLAKSYMSHEVSVAAGRAELPFERDFIEGVVENVNGELDGIIWNGVTIDGTKYKGFLDILADENIEKVATGATIYDSVKNVCLAIPAKALKNAVVFTGIDVYRDYVMEITKMNLYHHNPAVEGEVFKCLIPGTNTYLVGVPGLNDKNVIVAANVKHMFYGTDMANDQEVFKFWYSDDNQEFRLNIGFTAGVQFAFPSQVAWGDAKSVAGTDASGESGESDV